MNGVDELFSLIKKSRKMLFVLCGLPYSGKSFLSRRILKEAPCNYISIDKVLEEMRFDWNDNHLPDADGWKKALGRIFFELEAGLSTGVNVLYDSTNHTKASRDELRDLSNRVGADIKIIYLKASADLMRKRWAENKGTRERFVLDEKLLQITIEALEPPQADESPLIIEIPD